MSILVSIPASENCPAHWPARYRRHLQHAHFKRYPGLPESRQRHVQSGYGKWHYEHRSGHRYRPVAIVSGDFNNDGRPDLAVANTGGTVTLSLSNAANNFTYYTVDTLTGFGALTGITDGQFSTSGNLDRAVTDSTSNKVHILTGVGTGSFTTGASIAVEKDPTGIVSGDFNHDGLSDLAPRQAQSAC